MSVPEQPIINLHRLRYFAVLAEEGHFGRAATLLQIAQPGLSQQIRKLEREIGVALLERTGRSFSLTPAGSMLAGRSQSLLVHARDLVTEVRTIGTGHAGHLRLAYTRSAADLSPPALVEAFRREHPDVDVSVSTAWTAHNLELLDAGEIDAAFVRCPEPGLGYESLHIENEELVVAMASSHPLARRRTIARSQLADEAVIMWPRDQGPGFYDHIVREIYSTGPPRVVRHEPDAEQILAAVAAGHGIAVLDRRRAMRQRPAGVVIRRVSAPRPQAELALVWSRAHTSTVLTRFVRSLDVDGRTGQHPSP